MSTHSLRPAQALPAPPVGQLRLGTAPNTSLPQAIVSASRHPSLPTLTSTTYIPTAQPARAAPCRPCLPPQHTQHTHTHTSNNSQKFHSASHRIQTDSTRICRNLGWHVWSTTSSRRGSGTITPPWKAAPRSAATLSRSCATNHHEYLNSFQNYADRLLMSRSSARLCVPDVISGSLSSTRGCAPSTGLEQHHHHHL